jgi:hypothetical protein
MISIKNKMSWQGLVLSNDDSLERNTLFVLKELSIG